MSQVSALKDLNSILEEDLEQKERLCESMRKEIEEERRRSSQLEILLNPSHQLQVIYDNINAYCISFISAIYIQAKKQEKGKAEEVKKDIPGVVSI